MYLLENGLWKLKLSFSYNKSFVFIIEKYNSGVKIFVDILACIVVNCYIII